MSEWLVMAAFGLAAAAMVALVPWRQPVPEHALDELRERRRRLLAELRELDDDLAAGRITSEDRVDGRRALGPELREVTERLRAGGDDLVTERVGG